MFDIHQDHTTDSCCCEPVYKNITLSCSTYIKTTRQIHVVVNLYTRTSHCHVRHTTRPHDRFTFAVHVPPTRLHHRGFFGLFGGNVGLFWQKYRALLERDIRSLYLVCRHACSLHVYYRSLLQNIVSFVGLFCKRDL